VNPIGANLATSRIDLSNCLDDRPAVARQTRGETDASVLLVQISADHVDLIGRLLVRTDPDNDFTITHVARQCAGHGITDSATKRESYVACVHLRRLGAYDIWCDGEHESPGPLETGIVHVNDMRHSRPQIRLQRSPISQCILVTNFCSTMPSAKSTPSSRGRFATAVLRSIQYKRSSLFSF
jgi:hypothetical protein